MWLLTVSTSDRIGESFHKKMYGHFAGPKKSGPRLSLRAGGWGFPPATMSVAPGYFYGKIEEKQNQKKSLAVWFPFYLLYVPGNLKS